MYDRKLMLLLKKKLILTSLLKSVWQNTSAKWWITWIQYIGRFLTYTSNQSYKWPPNIFTLGQKVKLGHIKFMILINVNFDIHLCVKKIYMNQTESHVSYVMVKVMNGKVMWPWPLHEWHNTQSDLIAFWYQF